ncbi:hypothetical protein VK792_08685 [Mesobacterium sp. TK19101]|uniref:Flagellar FliJ protein n=1 Tax=Mesobacterium hydrothermale TaxID=3111907 RepID=A0ABU6HFX5_9RHOB|nr:hypothetical protein [Mesobacterium sp. TK19101]MEC3861359.1 hypothetical protein [Mesobacterium sp. TK19101]
MVQITALQRRSDEQRLAAVRAEIDGHQQQIAEIDALGRQAFSPDPSAFARQSLGADVAWRDHLSRQRVRLVGALASLRAQELAVQDQLRNSFGRDQAMHNLLQQEQDRLRRHDQTKRAKALEDLVLMSVTRNSPT